MFKLILISLPSPEAELFALARIYLPFSLFPNVYSVFASAPLTFLTSKVASSFSVKSNITFSLALDNEKRKIENIIDDKIFFTKTSIDNFIIFSILRIYSGNKTIFGAEQLPS